MFETMDELICLVKRGYALRILPLLAITCCFTLELAPVRCSSDPLQETAKQLLQKVVDRELRDAQEDHSLWTYDRTTRQSGHAIVKKVMETRQGDIERLISMDGKPLTYEQQEKEKKRLQSLLADPKAAKNLQKDRDQDAKRAQHLLGALPSATIASYGARRGNIIELRFEPNPAFHSTSHETEVLHSMSGTILVDSSQNRIAQIDGQIVKPVKFGGGLLGHLDKGGTFHVIQSQVQPGHWETTKLIVHMRGKALLFRTVNVEQDESRTNFEQMPGDLSLAQAVKKLKETSSAGG